MQPKFKSQSQINIWDLDQFFVKMDKRLKVRKWVLIDQPKIPQMPQNLSAQIFCPSPKVWDFDEKILHQASVVRGQNHIWAHRKKFNDKTPKVDKLPIVTLPTSVCDLTRQSNLLFMCIYPWCIIPFMPGRSLNQIWVAYTNSLKTME